MKYNIILDSLPEYWDKETNKLSFIPNLKLLKKPNNWNNIDQSKIGIRK
jgi:hypothetical protein